MDISEILIKDRMGVSRDTILAPVVGKIMADAIVSENAYDQLPEGMRAVIDRRNLVPVFAALARGLQYVHNNGERVIMNGWSLRENLIDGPNNRKAEIGYGVNKDRLVITYQLLERLNNGINNGAEDFSSGHTEASVYNALEIAAILAIEEAAHAWGTKTGLDQPGVFQPRTVDISVHTTPEQLQYDLDRSELFVRPIVRQGIIDLQLGPGLRSRAK